MLKWYSAVLLRTCYSSAFGARSSLMNLHYLWIKARLFFDRTEGASAIEYAIVIAMVAVVVLVFVGPLGDRVLAMFNNITTGLGGAAQTRPTP
jgi:pilus assembly protein Flp/PilA